MNCKIVITSQKKSTCQQLQLYWLVFINTHFQKVSNAARNTSLRHQHVAQLGGMAHRPCTRASTDSHYKVCCGAWCACYSVQRPEHNGHCAISGGRSYDGACVIVADWGRFSNSVFFDRCIAFWQTYSCEKSRTFFSFQKISKMFNVSYASPFVVIVFARFQVVSFQSFLIRESDSDECFIFFLKKH